MASITRETSRIGSLLASTNRVEAPFVRVELAGYSFGVYEGKSKSYNGKNGIVENISAKYPNYIQDLTIKKINGTVNQYTLVIKYPITENNDPNFFEKLLSNAGMGGKIKFEYGDSMVPDFIYKDEEAIITNVKEKLGVNEAVIQYTIEAVSASTLTLSGSYMFYARKNVKPSDIIKEKIKDTTYHLTDVFKGMTDPEIVDSLIASDDMQVDIPTCTNMSILEYLSFLVSYMKPNGSSSIIKNGVYSLTTFEDTTGTYGGAYFKVQKIQKAASALNQLCVYDVDIGFPSANIVSSFDINNNECWSIYYDYNSSLDNSDYLKRIGNNGELTDLYSPQVTNTKFSVKEYNSTWWTKVTQYPIEASMTIKGLLRPAVLMTYVKVNIWYFGHKHIASGYYIIEEQTDKIGISGYNTTLKLLRVAGDEEIDDMY